MQINTALFHRSMYLDGNKLLPANASCPFCNSTIRNQVHTLQQKPDVVLLECNTCQAVSASRMPTDEALAEYYSGYYVSSASQISDEKITFDEPLRLARHLAEIYCRHAISTDGATVSILDFGGGDGTIAHLLATILIGKGIAQVTITVVDYNKNVVEPSDSRIIISRSDSLLNVDGSFTFVIASAVIEHYPEPRALLEDLLHKLKKGGVFYARTPFMLPVMKVLQFIGIKVDFTFPGHLHDLGQFFWEYFFTMKENSSFRIVRSTPSIVETTFGKHAFRTITAHLLKFPWYVLGKSYKYVGGWEVSVLRV